MTMRCESNRPSDAIFGGPREVLRAANNIRDLCASQTWSGRSDNVKDSIGSRFTADTTYARREVLVSTLETGR